MPKLRVVDPAGMLRDIPEADLPKKESDFWYAVAIELHNLMTYAQTARDPQIVLNPYRKANSQYIWEFYVNDLALPVASAYNFHGQNVSQWQYSGAIVLQGGEVSRHH